MTPDPRLCLALDTAHLADARALVERTRHVFGVYKIGLQLHCAAGRAAIDAVRAAGGQRIFLDLKLHDIPQTVAGAVAALADLGVDLLTVHLAGGRKMLDAARRAAVAGPKLLGVTVLTSLDAAALAQTGIDRPLAEVAAARAALAV
ncbi:MAG: orotidine 5'-phosphate decarboxylase, partial [Myxococcales bacterium]|nr:orotidine 5'-phosphate decarboxylase [Myxococcales bacterium]